MNAWSERVRKALRTKGMTQADLAEKVDVSERTIRRYLRGNHTGFPAIKKAIEKELGIS